MSVQKQPDMTSNMPNLSRQSTPEAINQDHEAILKPIIHLLDIILKEYDTVKDPSLFGQKTMFKIEEFLENLQDTDTVRRRKALLNRCKSGIIDKLWEQLGPNHALSGTDFLILEYLFCCYPLQLICQLVNKDLKTVIVRKSRIKRIIMESDAPDKQLFLDSIMDYR